MFFYRLCSSNVSLLAWKPLPKVTRENYSSKVNLIVVYKKADQTVSCFANFSKFKLFNLLMQNLTESSSGLYLISILGADSHHIGGTSVATTATH